MPKVRYNVNDDGMLVDRDGNVLGRLTSLTIDTAEKSEVAASSLGAMGEQFGLELGEGSKDEGPPTPSAVDSVDDVWEHYVATMQPRNTTLNPQERRLIREALKVATTDELKLAITGCRQSAFHMGQNDRNRKYNRLSQIIKGRVGKETTRERIDYFIDIAVKAGYSLTGVAGSASEGWVDVDALPSVHRATITDLRRRVVLAHRSGDTVAEATARDELRAEGFEVVFEGDRYVGVKRVQS